MLESRRESEPLRVLVVDDHRTFTGLLVGALDQERDLDCLGAAHSGAEARAMARHLRPDLVLMDVDLGDDDGLDVAADLVSVDADLLVVVLTAYCTAQVMRRAAGAGAVALLPKNGSLPGLLAGLRAARPGGLHVDPVLLRDLVADDAGTGGPGGPTKVAVGPLTRREQDVLEGLGRGTAVSGIARDLGISVHTCRGYVKAVLGKLGAHSQLEAVAIARSRGLLDENHRP